MIIIIIVIIIEIFLYNVFSLKSRSSTSQHLLNRALFEARCSIAKGGRPQGKYLELIFEKDVIL